MTPNTSLHQQTNTVQSHFFAVCAKEGVTLRTFQGHGILEGFSIVHDQQPYIVLNVALPISKQIEVFEREMEVLRSGLLEEGKSSLFLSQEGGSVYVNQ